MNSKTPEVVRNHKVCYTVGGREILVIQVDGRVSLDGTYTTRTREECVTLAKVLCDYLTDTAGVTTEGD